MTWIGHSIRNLSVTVLVIVRDARPAAASSPRSPRPGLYRWPAVDREGNVYFTDIINQRIMKLSVDGVLSTFRESSNVANGLLIDPQGRLIACEGAAFERPGVRLKGTPRVTRTDMETGRVEVLADRYEGNPLIGPNDVTIDGRGRLFSPSRMARLSIGSTRSGS
jgi:hypothetical protein